MFYFGKSQVSENLEKFDITKSRVVFHSIHVTMTTIFIFSQKKCDLSTLNILVCNNLDSK